MTGVEALQIPDSEIKVYPKPIFYPSGARGLRSGVTYSHYSEVPWDSARYPNFSPSEPRLFCPMTGEFYFDAQSFDCLQLARNIVGEKFIITSGHRSPIYNALVGGKPLSQHKKIAFDISILNHHFPVKVYQALRDAGFTGFGFYQTFIHVDMGWPRQWFSKRGKILWNSLGIS